MKKERVMSVLSKGRIAKLIVEQLAGLPFGTGNLKNNAMRGLGFVVPLSTTREIDAAWDEAKKKVVKLYPDKFVLDDRGVLCWNDGSVKILDKKISSKNFTKLNELAESEGCSVDSIVSKLISHYKTAKVKKTKISVQ